jgi:GMP synthase-like glutamine amidotransferase
MKIHALYHVPFESLGSIGDWIIRKGYSLVQSHLYLNNPLPEPYDFDLLIIMGGSMSTSDEVQFPWLKNEKYLIRRACEENKSVLGICLGAQLIADALGARVYKNRHKEIGWFPVTFNRNALDPKLASVLPHEMNVFHWHGDTFDLPSGAFLLAGSSATENQGFVVGKNVMALQFHAEMRKDDIERLCKACADELVQDQYVQSLAELKQPDAFLSPANRLMDSILDYLEMNLQQSAYKG